MTHEQIHSVIKKCLLGVMISLVVSGAWYASKSGGNSSNNKPVELTKPVAEKATDVPKAVAVPTHYRIKDKDVLKQLDEILKQIVSPDNVLVIVQFHLPGDSDSEQLAVILQNVQKRFGRQVLVIRVDFDSYPDDLKKRGVEKLPYVMMIAGSKTMFEFQGLWSQPKVERKVEEILHGLLKRIDKNWRPPVPGMTPVGG